MTIRSEIINFQSSIFKLYQNKLSFRKGEKVKTDWNILGRK